MAELRTTIRNAFGWLTSLCLLICVLVTLAAGVIFALYPRELIDFVQVAYIVKRDFREPLDLGHMLDGAVSGLAESAGDRYTYFLTPEQNKTVVMSSQGLTGVVGITVDGVKEREDRLIVREVRPDSGADIAGIRVDDAIIKVGDMLISDLTVDEAVALIRGLPDTYVLLLIEREGEEPREYNVQRLTTIAVDTVQSGFLVDDYLPGYKLAYMYIDYFAGNTDAMFDEQLDGLLEDGAQALILDLRFNGGGDVAATSHIAGRLLPDGVLMGLRMREGEHIFHIENARPIDIPYAILVNGGSASASEILAGVVQDGQGGLLVGTRTYGKGSVQSLYNLNTGSGLRVTEGRYYLPGGRSIDGEGIMPDYVVENDPDSDRDDPLDMAVALL